MDKFLIEGANKWMNEDEDVIHYVDYIQNHPIFNIIKDVGLEQEWNENPEGMAFDLTDAVYLYVIDYNEHTELIANLQQLLRKVEYKPSSALGGYEDLEEYGKMIYDALVSKSGNDAKEDDTQPIESNEEEEMIDETSGEFEGVQLTMTPTEKKAFTLGLEADGVKIAFDHDDSTKIFIANEGGENQSTLFKLYKSSPNFKPIKGKFDFSSHKFIGGNKSKDVNVNVDKGEEENEEE